MQHTAGFCFCTLALGENYCNLALELAKDLEEYSPNTYFIILTDKPQYFYKKTNVLAFKHQQKSIGCYHDKRFAIAKALSLFNSCIFIDADMRILAAVPNDLRWQPGVTAKIVWHNIVKHNKNKVEIEILKKVSRKYNLNLEDISFVHECLFVVTRDEGREIDFLLTWERIAAYCELNQFYRGEGHTIGLAAAKAGLQIRSDPMAEIYFFKDKLELQKIKQGEAEVKKNSIYFEIQQKLEYPQISIFKRVINKIRKMIMHFYRSSRLKILSLKDINFYYR